MGKIIDRVRQREAEARWRRAADVLLGPRKLVPMRLNPPHRPWWAFWMR